MGQAVIGGVITSSLLTLVVVPVVYCYMDDLAALAGQKRLNCSVRKAPPIGRMPFLTSPNTTAMDHEMNTHESPFQHDRTANPALECAGYIGVGSCWRRCKREDFRAGRAPALAFADMEILLQAVRKPWPGQGVMLASPKCRGAHVAGPGLDQGPTACWKSGRFGYMARSIGLPGAQRS